MVIDRKHIDALAGCDRSPYPKKGALATRLQLLIIVNIERITHMHTTHQTADMRPDMHQTCGQSSRAST